MGCQALVIKFLGGSFESIMGDFQTHGVSLAGIDCQAGTRASRINLGFRTPYPLSMDRLFCVHKPLNLVPNFTILYFQV